MVLDGLGECLPGYYHLVRNSGYRQIPSKWNIHLGHRSCFKATYCAIRTHSPNRLFVLTAHLYHHLCPIITVTGGVSR